MSSFPDNLKFLRKNRHLSQVKLAEALGVSNSIIAMYETGQRKPSFEMIEEIADYFNVNLSSLLGDSPVFSSPFLSVTTRRVPILGGAACGTPIYAPGDGAEYATVPGDLACDFALIAHGDSMIGDRIHDGDAVFFIACDDVADGQIAAVSIDDEVTIKHVKRLRAPDGAVLYTMLLSSNPAYNSIDIGGADETRNVRILGKAISFSAKLNLPHEGK